jgi:hypothetical protein
MLYHWRISNIVEKCIVAFDQSKSSGNLEFGKRQIVRAPRRLKGHAGRKHGSHHVGSLDAARPWRLGVLHRFNQQTDRALPDRPYVFDSLDREFVQLAGLVPGTWAATPTRHLILALNFPNLGEFIACERGCKAVAFP